jgi:cation diffusion facilitator family transporter
MASAVEVTRSGVRRVLWTTLLLNLAVSGAKILVGTLTASLAMVADGYHSLVDGSNNVIGLVVAAFAYRPPDTGHPYGHRKFETAATLVIGGALLLLAGQIAVGALARTGRSEPPAIGLANWAVMVATLAVNFFVSRYEAQEGHRLGSAYLVADAAHTRSDLLVSLGVILSFAVGRLGLPQADAVVAIGIAGVIAWQASRILVAAFNVLTDRAALPAEAIESVLREIPEVRSSRDIRTRGAGDAVYVDLCVHVDGGMSLHAAHEVADRIEEAIMRAHPEIVDVVVHLEPASAVAPESA